MSFSIDKLQWKDGVARAMMRNGCVAKIFTAKGMGDRPVVGQFHDHGHGPFVTSWSLLGTSQVAAYDLVECLPPEKAKIKVDCWLNIMPNGECLAWSSRCGADVHQYHRVACLHIVREIEEGEGL